MKNIVFAAIASVFVFSTPEGLSAQTVPYTAVTIKSDLTYQTMAGFGASLAYYEGWLPAHPNKQIIYDAIFGELSLDILRVRNAYGYDATMVGKVKEFAQAAAKSLGKPIDIMVTSWGPPAYLKSNNDRNNGGTLKYSVSGGKVTFNYAGFARWWNESLANYNANGIYPAYISIQNEPDWKASYESCLLRPTETLSGTDTIAGYNKALDAVYDTIQTRDKKPKILGPESIGIGYNAVENYINALDVKKLYGIAHHLYHGVDENNPYASTDFTKVGIFHPEIPHFQTEYNRGDWFALAGLIFKSLNDENAVAYLYWDLIWTGGGLVDLEFPWDKNQWHTPQGFTKTKNFYAFKQFSAFIHPGWKRINISSPSAMVKTVSFISADRDSAVLVAVNTSATTPYSVKPVISGYKINESGLYRTSANENCVNYPSGPDSVVVLNPKSITTVTMKISENNTGIHGTDPDPSGPGQCSVYPNPFRSSATLHFYNGCEGIPTLTVCDFSGRTVSVENLGYYPPGSHQYILKRRNLSPGIYLFLLEFPGSTRTTGKFIITD